MYRCVTKMIKRQIHACNDYRYPLLGIICVQSHAEIKLNPVLQIVSGDETIDWTPLIKSPYKLEGDSVQFCLLCCGYGFARTRVVGVWPAHLLAQFSDFKLPDGRSHTALYSVMSCFSFQKLKQLGTWDRITCFDNYFNKVLPGVRPF